MAIIPYDSESGETLYRVYVNLRSKDNSAIRVQRKVSGFKTEKEAEREETRLVRDCEREISTKENQGITWGELIARWEQSLTGETRVSEITRMDYIAALKKHTDSWWKREAREISRADVKELLNQLKALGNSNSFQAKTKNLLNRIFVFGIEDGHIRGMERSPAHGIPVGRHEEKKPEILTIAEIRKLLQEARRYQHPWYRVWAMALLTGMRSGELYALEWSDVDLESRSLSVTKSFNCRFKQIKCTKSGDWRTVPISGELLNLLEELKAQGDAQTSKRSSVLPRLREWNRGMQATELRKFCLGIGIPSIKFHTLRACFATQLLRNGIPAIRIQKICGWKDLETMQRYIRLAGIEIDGMTETLKVLPDPRTEPQERKLLTAGPVTDSLAECMQQ